MALQGIMLSENKSVTKGYILYDSVYLTSLKMTEMENRFVVDRDKNWGIEEEQGGGCVYKRATQRILVM